MPETFFQKIGKREELIEGFGAREKLYQHVDIAVRAGLTTQYGAEQGKALDTESADLRLGGSEAFNHLFSRERGRFHSR